MGVGGGRGQMGWAVCQLPGLGGLRGVTVGCWVHEEHIRVGKTQRAVILPQLVAPAAGSRRAQQAAGPPPRRRTLPHKAPLALPSPRSPAPEHRRIGRRPVAQHKRVLAALGEGPGASVGPHCRVALAANIWARVVLGVRGHGGGGHVGVAVAAQWTDGPVEGYAAEALGAHEELDGAQHGAAGKGTGTPLGVG